MSYAKAGLKEDLQQNQYVGFGGFFFPGVFIDGVSGVF